MTDHDESTLGEFYRTLPQQLATTETDPEPADAAADDVERVVTRIQNLGYPPVDVDGPEPSDRPGAEARLLTAANQLAGLVLGLPDDAWDQELDGESVRDTLDTTRQTLTDLYGL